MIELMTPAGAEVPDETRQQFADAMEMMRVSSERCYETFGGGVTVNAFGTIIAEIAANDGVPEEVLDSLFNAIRLNYREFSKDAPDE